MSTRKAVVVTCDHKGCDAEYVGRASEIAGNQRKDAQGNHWGQRRTEHGLGFVRWLDLCPKHKD